MAYEFNGVEYPSVTTITGILDKPALLSWAANCAVDYIKDHISIIQDLQDVHRGEDILDEARKAYAKKRDDAASAGTQTHKAIEKYIAGEEYESILTTEESQKGFQAFHKWEETNHVVWLKSEVKVFSQTHGYAGRFDAIALVNGHLYFIDFKTSKAVYDEMFVQLCGYRQAVKEMIADGWKELDEVRDANDIAVLHLDKATANPTFHPRYEGFERMTETFNAMTRVYYLLKNRRLKNNPFVAIAKSLN